MSNSDDSALFPVGRDGYEGPYQDHLLEQYKLYVESADRVSERRTAGNNYLLTVGAAFLSLYGVIDGLGHTGTWKVAVPLAGLLVCFTWHRLLSYYRRLNTAKRNVSMI